VENASWICQGYLEGRLSEKGIQENRRLAKELRWEKIDKCYSSPLSRARETGEAILKYHPVELQTDRRLIERDMGILTGKRFPEGYALNRDYPKMESITDLAVRLHSFLEERFSKAGDQSVILITHGITIMVLIRILKGQEWEHLDLESMPANSSATIIETGDSFRL